jgi:hypothetical protein
MLVRRSASEGVLTWRALLLSIVLVSVPIRAEANESAVHVTLEAPDVCPTRDALLSGARKRASWIRFADAPAELAVDVRITKAARGFAAVVALRNGEGLEERSLNAVTCGELVDAAGLLIALFVKADAEARQSTEPPPAPPPPAALDAPPTAGERATAPAPRAQRWVPFLGAQLQSEALVLPDVAGGGALFAGLERSSGVLAPAGRLEASIASSDLAAGPSRVGSFLRGVGRADGCPLRFALTAWVSLRPCVWVGLGFVHAAGAAVPVRLAQTELWAEAGGRLRARAESGRIFLELEAGAVVPLTRPVFLIENPRSVVYATPPVGALVAIGGGVRFL